MKTLLGQKKWLYRKTIPNTPVHLKRVQECED